nr:reverse transcriptase domain-containing protein [Tanacetum cinerariifolium]
MFGQFMKINTASSLCTGSLPSNTVPNPRENLKAITTRSGVTLAGPLAHLPPSKEVDREPEMITDQLLELMLLKRPKENTKCVNAAGEELTAAKHKLKLLV